MNLLEKIYNPIWFTFEFLVKNPRLRRPFTFVFHDFAHRKPALYILVQLGLIFGLYWLTQSYWVLVPILYGFIQGHVLWGGHKVGEQEDPEYTGDIP